MHRHLAAQIAFLASRDVTLRNLIASIQIEEWQHLDYAAGQLTPSPVNQTIETVVNISTTVVIWLSTQGAVSRMEKTLRLTHIGDDAA